MKRLMLLSALLLGACATAPRSEFDVVIRNGTIYDGSGNRPVVGDVALRGDRIVAIGTVPGRGATEIDARGLAVAPGFINMLSWATGSLIADGRAQSDIRQGVTLEVFGEGVSMGPLNDAMKAEMKREQGDFKYEIDWTTLAEYLDSLVRRGISPNVASFVGATTVRMHVLGEEDRAPNAEELERMRDLVRQAMQDGALGVGSALIYAPAFYAKTDELVELCKVAREYDGMYISHLRSEGNRFVEAVNELLAIAAGAQIRAEIYHLKAAGRDNWPKLDEVIRRIEEARASGLHVTADMYTYTAGATGLDAAMPPWVQEGGFEAWRKRLQDPATRARVIAEMRTPSNDWENLMLLAGGGERVLLSGFKSDALKPLTGKTLAEVARMRGVSEEDAAIELVIEDGSRVETVYFLMSDENVRKQVALPWMSFGSDAGAPSAEGAFLKSNPHPRAYGNFANLLGRYVRDEKVIPLEEAIRKLTTMPAMNLGIAERGSLSVGFFADVVVFDPNSIAAKATFAQPHQYATGMKHVFVNGTQVLRDGEHTGAKPGRVVKRARGVR
ncbi:MAG TPA: D-aminoacylase [Thermoanaerobaculia bacterium]|jgi:N-acyl-D-amino-acid deacylase